MTEILMYLIEGKCLMTTSKAWIVSKGTLGSRPDSASCRACRLTQDTHLMATLKLRSFPSPGIVTSSSTCVISWEEMKRYNAVILQKYSYFFCFVLKIELLLLQVDVWNTYFISAYWQGHGSVKVLPSIIHRLSITKDLCFKVLDHVLHNFPEKKMKWTNYQQCPR